MRIDRRSVRDVVRSRVRPASTKTLIAQFGKPDFKSRPIQFDGWDDEIEA